MSFWDDAKHKVLQAMKPRQQESQGYIPNRLDGSMSGYTPRVKKSGDEMGQTGFRQGGVQNFAGMVPDGVDASTMQQFRPVAQTGTVPPQQGMPQQPVGQTGYQQRPVNPMGAAQPMGANQPMAAAQPMGQQQMPPRPQAQFQGQQRPFQSANPTRGFTTNQAPVQPQQGWPQQSQVPPQQNPAPVQNQPETFAFTGGDGYVVDGHAYKMVVRVAQITGVPSCFRVIEFMYNNEAVVVNAEQVTDLVEAERCMDLIFGAACAMKLRLMRVSGKQIYLITPPQVCVIPFENLGRAAMDDINRHWPGAMQANMQPPYNGQRPAGNVQPMNQPRQEDFAGSPGRRAARNAAMHTNGYTDYGGFGSSGR